MTRLLVLATALVFIAGFAFLTVASIAQQGFSLASLLRCSSSCCSRRDRRGPAGPPRCEAARTPGRGDEHEGSTGGKRPQNDHEHLAIHDPGPEPRAARAGRQPQAQTQAPGGPSCCAPCSLAAVILLSGVLGGSSAGGGAPSTTASTTRKAVPAAPRLSAYGLPLALPPSPSAASPRPRGPTAPRLPPPSARGAAHQPGHGRGALAAQPPAARPGREPDEDDDRAPDRRGNHADAQPVLITKAAIERRRLEGRRPARRRGMCPCESLLYGLLLPVRQRRGRRARRYTSPAASAAFVRRDEPAGGAARHGLHPLLLAVGLLRRRQLLLRRRPRAARARRPRPAADREGRAHTRPPIDSPSRIKGGKLYLYNNNPLLIYGYPARPA